MHGEENERMKDMHQAGLTQGEANELQTTLDSEEWAALLALQHTLANAPLLAPTAGFGDRVMLELAAREQQRAHRLRRAGMIILPIGWILFSALLFWLSPLVWLTQAIGWADLLNQLATSMGLLIVVLEIARVLVGVLGQFFGRETLVALSLFALLITILWTRIVADWTPLNRPVPA